MTNEEAIKILESIRVFRNGSNANVEAIDIAINSIQENTKLKAEINRLNGKSEMYRDMADSFCESNKKLKAEIDQWQSTNLQLCTDLTRVECENYQLKSDLEQSVKLPCKVGQIVYEIKSKFTKCTEHDCEFDDYSCQGCECLECDSKKEYYIRDIKFYSAENILVFERHFGKTIFLTREEAEQSLKGQV